MAARPPDLKLGSNVISSPGKIGLFPDLFPDLRRRRLRAMTLKYWILDDKGRPAEVAMLEWAKWFGTAERIIAQETIAQNWISTIFLGIDHSFNPHGAPLLWETMSFGAKLNHDMLRCAGSKEQAEAMHEDMVKRVCKASGIPYDPHRKRVNRVGVRRRLAAVHRKAIRELQKLTKRRKRPKL